MGFPSRVRASAWPALAASPGYPLADHAERDDLRLEPPARPTRRRPSALAGCLGLGAGPARSPPALRPLAGTAVGGDGVRAGSPATLGANAVAACPRLHLRHGRVGGPGAESGRQQLPGLPALDSL